MFGVYLWKYVFTIFLIETTIAVGTYSKMPMVADCFDIGFGTDL